jgi:uncharacterized membrane protein YkvA (DUF1232 family)
MRKTSPPPNLDEAAGVAGGLLNQIRLAWRLWNDGRVPGWVKLIPVAGLVYLLSPIDLIPDLMLPGLGEVDDVVLLFLALKAFVDLSPPGVVREHLERLAGKRRRPPAADSTTTESYIDVPYSVLDPAGKPVDPWADAADKESYPK